MFAFSNQLSRICRLPGGSNVCRDCLDLDLFASCFVINHTRKDIYFSSFPSTLLQLLLSMSRRQVVSVDDEDMIKAFLSRLDSRTHSQQNLSMPISPAPTVERPAAGAKAILPIATSETHHDAVLAQNADPLAHADTSTKEAVSASSAGTTPIGHGKDEDKWVDPRHRYDPKALRNHAPLLTHSASGALAAQRIQSIIDESTAEQPKPRDTEAVSSHRNRVPLPQIGKIAAQFQQWYSDPTSGTVRGGS